jgi:hypothetical protein
MILDKGSFNGLGTGLELVQNEIDLLKLSIRKLNKIS